MNLPKNIVIYLLKKNIKTNRYHNTNHVKKINFVIQIKSFRT